MNAQNVQRLLATVDAPPPPPLHQCVVAWGPDADGRYDWHVIDASGNDHQARQATADFLERHPESACYLMIPNGDKARARVVARVEWGK